ncbi:xanthine dehydrogenase accessory protein XdhC [Alteromonas stellipolaris]|jgi:xanthine dehydrogenase accessory factor|uniref:xanthine dehydrogenase accessory protein XdhC n=1 Tax=Alteromonas stellipolaris TaxID=233316 RepID=UPI00077057A8|nr:xanthine dehydrogenase accessory protein XdhC [Alteromonas stellipolaris]AMJ94190.1 xanthine dehydrogenase accessory protein XdhC [Alteromonas stellipolaris]ANB26798.1 xanthine dehydrogenase accessory protein XdhC [Alteromonas stellipolaris]
MKASTWYEAVAQCQQDGAPYVIVTVISIAGSTPREAGSKMVVTDAQSIDTIGGGHLEFDAIKTAREMLSTGTGSVGEQGKNNASTEIRSYPLSSKLGQCCGGAVKVLFEVCNRHAQHIAIFGAGHVAKALIPILAQLPLRISWIDSREDLFSHPLPANVKKVVEEAPETEVRGLEENTWLVILTHDHQLDYRITEQALKYPALPFVGLIGSQTKAKRFITKLEHRGFNESDLARLATPIGDTSIPGKRPIEVAVSIASQIIQRLHASEDNNQDTAVTKAATFKNKEHNV